MSVQGKLGFRILPSAEPIEAALLDRFLPLSSCTVADAMGRFNFMHPAIQARTGLPLCGVAVTVNARPGDNLMIHKVMQVARAGEIVVVNTGENITSAVFGDMICETSVAMGIGGIVVDGAIRDVDGIRQLGFPAFSRAVSPGSCDRDGPGEINVPISCGGIVVCPGDIVVGDADGVAVVPRAHAEEVLATAQLMMERERLRIAEIKSGTTFNVAIDETLRRHGVIA